MSFIAVDKKKRRRKRRKGRRIMGKKDGGGGREGGKGEEGRRRRTYTIVKTKLLVEEPVQVQEFHQITMSLYFPSVWSNSLAFLRFLT